MPFNSPCMSLTFSRHVRFIFHACPVLSLRVISLHLPSCRLVSWCFISLSFPLHSPCFHFCPLHVPFSSPLFPFHFPLLCCHVDFLFPPLISLGTPNQQRAGRGNRAWDPCSPAPRRLRLVERHQIAARSGGGGEPCVLTCPGGALLWTSFWLGGLRGGTRSHKVPVPGFGVSPLKMVNSRNGSLTSIAGTLGVHAPKSPVG